MDDDDLELDLELPWWLGAGLVSFGCLTIVFPTLMGTILVGLGLMVLIGGISGRAS